MRLTLEDLSLFLDMRVPDGVHLSREEMLALRELMEAEILRMVSERANDAHS